MLRTLVMGGAVLVASACSLEPYDYDQTTVEIEVISPAITGGGEAIYAAHGPILLGSHITKDGGATWADLHPAIVPSISQAPNDHELIVSTTEFGLGRWDMATDVVTPIPSLGAPDHWHVRPATDTFLMHLLGTTDYGRQVGTHGAMTRVPIPPPPGPLPTTNPDTFSIESNATVAVMASQWGQYRSLDDGQSWEYVAPPNTGSLEWLTLDDGRFLLFNQNRTADIYDATGMPTGQFTVPFSQSFAHRIACRGAIIDDQQFTRDLGVTWEPLLPMQMGLPLHAGAVACGGDYLLVFVDTPVKLMVKMTTLGELGPGVNAPVREPVSVTSAFRSAGGTWFGGNFAWKEGDPVWSLRLLPTPNMFALADGSLIGIEGTTVYRSRDEGLTFTSTVVPTAPVGATRVLSGPSESLWAVSGAGTQARLWRSTDDGATWTDIYNTAPGPHPELVAIGADGTFVLRGTGTELFVSHDQAATFTALPFPSPFALAFITNSGDAATWDMPTDEGLLGHCWHLWRDYGLGSAYRQVVPTMAGMPVELGDSGKSPILDAEDRFYVFGGGTQQGVFRSTAPLTRD